MRQAGFWLLLCVVMAGALAMRLPSLSARPMHGDEAVHTVKCWELYSAHRYRYDPNEYHGPTLYYATLPILALRHRTGFGGTTETDYRLVTVLFGALLMLPLALLRDGLGRRAVLVAGLLLAISPAFVYYSRYYIQEILLVWFTLLAAGAAWRYARSGGFGWLITCSLACALMVASKETAPLSFAAAAAGLWASRRWAGQGSGAPRIRIPRQQLAIAALVGIVAAWALLSGFGASPGALLDYGRAYTPWLHRAGTGALHRHPWSAYLAMLAWTHRARGPVWSEALILALAAIGAASALRSRRGASCDPSLVRAITVSTIVLTVLYSAIPYKTPWCVLSFLAGYAVLAGVGVVRILDALRRPTLQIAALVGLLAGCWQLGGQAHRAAYLYPTDGRNPYAYAHPVPDVIECGKRVEDIARAQPESLGMLVRVIHTDDYYWPLPWYLRRLTNVGYWSRIPEPLDAPVILAAPVYDEALTKRLDATHLMTGYYGLRPGTVFQVWVRMDAWQRYLKVRGPVTDD